MRQLCLAVPSRGRPQNIARLWQTMKGSCTGDTTLLVGLDEDDPCLDEYLDLYITEAHPNLRVMVRGDLRQVVAWTNELVASVLGEFAYFGAIGDDNLPHTYGWDAQIAEALQDAPFAFGNDLYPRVPGSLCCHVFARAEVPAALGYFGPPGIRHMYVDVAWMAWGVATKISYLHGTVIEHLHYTAGKAAPDHSYAVSTGLIPADCLAWHTYSRSPQLNEDIRKISAAMPFRVSAHRFTPDILRRFNRDLNIPEDGFR